MEAIKESWRLTKGHKWSILRLAVLMTLVNVLGFLLLLVGLLVTIPVTMLAFVRAYRVLSGAVTVPVVAAGDVLMPAAPPAETVVTAAEVDEPSLPTAAATPAEETRV